MYNYYYIKTDNLSDSFSTSTIEKHLRSYGIFKEKNGNFISQNPFLDISLLKVKDPDAWNSLDYSSSETNYISIVTSCFSDNNCLVSNILHGLENITNSKIFPDD